MRVLDYLNDPAVSSIAATTTSLSIARMMDGNRTVEVLDGSDYVGPLVDARTELIASAKKSPGPKLSRDTPMLVTERLVTELGIREDVTPLASNALLVSLTDASLASGATFTVARKSSMLERLVSGGMLSTSAAVFLRTVARARASIVITGMTGSGKSMLYYALLEGLELRSRAVSVERPIEIRLGRGSVVQLEDAAVAPDGAVGTALRTLALADFGRLALDGIRDGDEVESLVVSTRRARSSFLATMHSRPGGARERLEDFARGSSSAVDLIVEVEPPDRDGIGKHRFSARVYETTTADADSGLRMLWSDAGKGAAREPSRSLRRRLSLD